MIHLVIALGLIVLGYLVKYQKWSWLIAGYNTSSQEQKDKYDVDALCNVVGNFMFVLSVILLIAVSGEYLGLDWVVATGWILFFIVSVATLIYINTGNRYMK